MEYQNRSDIQTCKQEKFEEMRGLPKSIVFFWFILFYPSKCDVTSFPI